jgi:hypothetical protein
MNNKAHEGIARTTRVHVAVRAETYVTAGAQRLRREASATPASVLLQRVREREHEYKRLATGELAA